MAGRGRRKKNNNRAGKLCIGMIVIAFVAVMSVQIIRVYQKDQEYMQQEASLQKQLEEETSDIWHKSKENNCEYYYPYFSGNPVIHLGAADFLGSPDKFPR